MNEKSKEINSLFMPKYLQNLYLSALDGCQSLWPKEDIPFFKKAAFFLFRVYIKWQVFSLYLIINFAHYNFYTWWGRIIYAFILGSSIPVPAKGGDYGVWQAFCIFYIALMLGFSLGLLLFLRIPVVKRFCNRHLGERYLSEKLGNTITKGFGMAVAGGSALYACHEGSRVCSNYMNSINIEEVNKRVDKYIGYSKDIRDDRIARVTQNYSDDPKRRDREIDRYEKEHQKNSEKIRKDGDAEIGRLYKGNAENIRSDSRRLESVAKHIVYTEAVGKSIGLIDPLASCKRASLWVIDKIFGRGGGGASFYPRHPTQIEGIPPINPEELYHKDQLPSFLLTKSRDYLHDVVSSFFQNYIESKERAWDELFHLLSSLKKKGD